MAPKRTPTLEATVKMLTEAAVSGRVEVEWTAPDGTKIKITPAGVAAPAVPATVTAPAIPTRPIDDAIRKRIAEHLAAKVDAHMYGASGLAPVPQAPRESPSGADLPLGLR